MPFGLTNAPATFQRLMDRLISPEWEPHVFAFLDDVIIATDTEDAHFEFLEKVLRVLSDAGLEINREKSEFFCPRVKYLRYVIGAEGLKSDPDKVAPILQYPPPKNLKQLRRFLGMVGWYARFLANFSAVKAPLTYLLTKDTPWERGREQQKAFDSLREALTKTPILAHPDFTKPFSLQTDASDLAVGLVLTQTIDDVEHPIAYICE